MPRWPAQFLGGIERYNQMVDERYIAQFEGKVQPGVGCNACPDLCERIDLRPMEPIAFQERYRQTVHDIQTKGKPESSLATWEQGRLECMAEAAGKPLLDALLALMDPSEHGMVRLDVAHSAIARGLDRDRGAEVLRELARGEGRSAQYAQGILDRWAEGTWPFFDP